MQLYNTLTRRKAPFQPRHDPISMYVCGITPYDDAHLGHAMSIVVFDVLRRYLEWDGRAVRLVYNFTDIDDKMIARARRLAISVPELAARQIDRFQQEWRELHIRAADVHPRATQEIDKMQEVIARLIDQDAAYAAGGDVYFRVEAPPDYGKLSNRSLRDMIAGARIEQNSQKAHPMDFTLWKGAKPGEPSWESPWGPGRPGWHIECSAMALRYLGEQIDLHGGGMDLIFPHHENEIAQSEGFSGKRPFVGHWVHNAMMQLGDEKMSKSLGNIISLREGLDRYGGRRPAHLHPGRPLPQPADLLRGVAGGLGARRRATAHRRRRRPAGGPGRLRRRGGGAITSGAPWTTTWARRRRWRCCSRSRTRSTAPRPRAAPPGRRWRCCTSWAACWACASKRGGTTRRRPRSSICWSTCAGRLRAAKQYALADELRDDLRERGVVLEDGRDGTTWRSAEPTVPAAATPAGAPSAAKATGKAADTLRF